MPTTPDRPENRGKQEPSPFSEPDQQSSSLSPREQQTAAGLRRLDPQLAGLYELGRELVNEIEKPGYAHAVAYVARELSRGVIRCRLRDEGIDTSAQNGAEAESAVDGEGDQQRGQGDQQRIAAALQLTVDDPRVTQWKQMPGRFAAWEKYRYGGPPPDDVREAFEQFSQMLFGLAAPYYATEAELDDLLAVDVPTSEDAKRLQDLQLRPAQRRHFFDRLKDPRWVKHLANQGFFANPPGRQVYDGSWSPRPWPEGDYLIRIASEAPAAVVGVLVTVPLTNDNPEVWNSVAKAASHLPANLAVRVAPLMTSALESVSGLTLWSDSVVGLIEHLAAAGSSEAFVLADHLLLIAGEIPAEKTDAAFRNRTDWVVPRLGGQHWEGAVDRVVTALEATDPQRTLRLLVSKMGRIQELVDAIPTGSEFLIPPRVKTSLEDSFDREGRNRRDVATVTMLGRSTVGVARRLATTGREEAADVVALLKERDGRFFARLRCHVLGVAGHFLPGQLDQFLLSKEARNPGYPATEVAALLRAQFRNASAAARRAYAAGVEVGPDRDELRAGLEAWSQETVTDADVEDQLRQWQQRILTFFRGDVPQEFHDLLSQLALEGVTPSRRDHQLAEHGVYSESEMGEYGRDTVHSLTGRAVEEVVDILGEHGTADYIALRDYAREQPTDGVRILAKCADGDVPPGTIEGVLIGLADAVEAGSELDWALVLQSLLRVIRQIGAQEVPGATRLARWRRVWDNTARLIDQGCVKDGIPPELARKVWDALEDATTLPAVWLGPIRDPTRTFDRVLSTALNDGAGTVASAAIAAGLWQYRFCLPSGETSSEEDKATAREHVQERLVPILDALLDVGGPYKPVPRALIGQRLPWLFLLVPEWLDRNTDRLLGGGLEDPVAQPAWTAYISRDALYGSVFDALRPWYVRAASDAAIWRSKLETVAQRPSEITKRLAAQLVTAFLRGWIQRGDDDGLLEIAYTNLSPSDWSYGYFRIFRDFRDADQPVSTAVIERLVELWEWRISEITQQPRTADTMEEADGLSQLLSTPQIPAEAVVRLGPDTARHAGGRVWLDWEKLLELAQSDPEGAFEIADAVLGGTLRARHGYVPVDDVKPLLGFVLQTAKAEIQERARGLIHRLGERGYRDFKDLLEDV